EPQIQESSRCNHPRPSRRRPPSAAEPRTAPCTEWCARTSRPYKEQHYAAWVDQPIPALAGKTPRQAARSETGRAKLDLLLRDSENHEARLPDGARFEIARLRRDLQLEA